MQLGFASQIVYVFIIFHYSALYHLPFYFQDITSIEILILLRTMKTFVVLAIVAFLLLDIVNSASLQGTYKLFAYIT